MITLNLLERLFNIEINKDKDIGKVTVQYGPITTVKRYHTNIFQQFLNRIFRTQFQTIKELNTKIVCVTLTTNEGKMYTTVFTEDILDKVTTYNVIEYIIRPFGYKLLAATRRDEELFANLIELNNKHLIDNLDKALRLFKEEVN